MLLFRGGLFLLLLLRSVLAQAEPTVSEAWIRALPPTQPVTAAYAAVTNSGAELVKLVGARIEGVGRVEIHTTREVDGLMRMQQLQELAIAPGQTVALAPGGAHFMLFELEAMPRPGESRSLCLLFEGAGEQCVTATVRKSAEADHSHHQHH
ncbi:copper chaperone PCu(A)C [Seongchinamella sediminis]|uniref:copper chaperone PCu(A)C n=1 Tax=Seongchinamella sediminis TaxID=2283635 RepID=UPI0013C3606B|nr:copper chaperone PCu(A)C [Seongchinamella sediminis]